MPLMVISLVIQVKEETALLQKMSNYKFIPCKYKVPVTDIYLVSSVHNFCFNWDATTMKITMGGKNLSGVGGGRSSGHTFLKKTLTFLGFSLYPWKRWSKQSFIPENSAGLCYTPWKFQDQEPRPTEIRHDFYWISP